MVFDLAGIRRPQEVRNFARRYGLLRSGPGSDEYREPWSLWEDTAHDLSLVIDTYASLAAIGVQEELNEEPNVEFAREAPERLRRILRNRLGSASPALLPHLAHASVADIVAIASDFVSDLLTERLSAIAQRVIAPRSKFRGDFAGAPPHHFGLLISPSTLEQMAWQQLAMTIVTRVPTAACPECRQLFLVTREGRRYCSERCGNRARARRYQARRRADNKEAKG